MEASAKAKVYTIHFNHKVTLKGSNYTCPGGWLGLPVIIGLISVQLHLKLDFQLELRLAIRLLVSMYRNDPNCTVSEK